MDKEFNTIYKNYYNQILIYVNSKIKNLEISEELTNEIFLKVFKYLNTYDKTKGNFNNWLFKIASNLIIDYVRNNKQKYNYITIDNEINENNNYYFKSLDKSDTSIIKKEIKNNIITAINKIKPKYRLVVKLYFIDQLQYNEISNMCNISMENVKVILNRSRIILKNELEKIYHDIL